VSILKTWVALRGAAEAGPVPVRAGGKGSAGGRARPTCTAFLPMACCDGGRTKHEGPALLGQPKRNVIRISPVGMASTVAKSDTGNEGVPPPPQPPTPWETRTDATGIAWSRSVTLLGIESSCDDTAVAVVRVGGGLPAQTLAHATRSTWSHHAARDDIDKAFAAAGHAAAVGPLVDEVIEAAYPDGGGWDSIDAIALTVGPGMMGGLQAGLAEALKRSRAHGKPIIPVNHLEGHALAAGLDATCVGAHGRSMAFPMLVLIASGGSCQLVLARALGDYVRLGATIDRAPGEVLDKAARAIGLDADGSGAGGGAIERAAAASDPTDALEASRRLACIIAHGNGNAAPQVPQGCDFSFVPLRDAAMRLGGLIVPSERCAAAAAVQSAVITHLVDRVDRAVRWCLKRVRLNALIIAGGVASNGALRAALASVLARAGAQEMALVCPPPELCTDNGRMIAFAAGLHLLASEPGRFPVERGHICLHHEWPIGVDASPALARAFASSGDVDSNLADDHNNNGCDTLGCGTGRAAAANGDDNGTMRIVRVTRGDDVGPAADALCAGRLVAFHTETVYGLGADACSDAAARDIFVAKGRPADNPLIVHVASLAQLDEVVGLDTLDAVVRARVEALAARFWPGPLTMLLPNNGTRRISPVVTCGQPLVGMRMPDSPGAVELIARAGVPVAAPSANRSGSPSPTSAAHVVGDLAHIRGEGGQPIVWGVVDGGDCCAHGIESTVVDVTTTPLAVYREGPVGAADIADALGLDAATGGVVVAGFRATAAGGCAPKAPGMKYRHYAPSVPVTVIECDDGALSDVVRLERDRGMVGLDGNTRSVRVGVIATERDIVGPHAAKIWYCLGKIDTARSLAANLYAALRGLDVPERIDRVLVRAVPGADGIASAVMERLAKASEGRTMNITPTWHGAAPTAAAPAVVGPFDAHAVDERHERTARLLGTDAVRALNGARVMVVGLGGVGGCTSEYLVRMGVGSLVLVDPDTIELSNFNRQAQSHMGTLGERKIDAASERFRSINPSINVTGLPVRINATDDPAVVADVLALAECDLIVDAIDDIAGKGVLIAACRYAGVRVLSVMGAANKLDVSGSRFLTADIADVHTCPMALFVRDHLRKVHNITDGVPAVFSDARHYDMGCLSSTGCHRDANGAPLPCECGSDLLGTTVMMVARGGAHAAHEAVRMLVNWTAIEERLAAIDAAHPPATSLPMYH